MCGSSPRLWGILHVLQHFSQTERFIPTPVGHTMPMKPISSMWPVHPHACGAYFSGVKFYTTLFGSSPRLWGIQIYLVAYVAPARFIPTPVGHTDIPRCLCRASSVHPHACGAYVMISCIGSFNPGSSPRLWGIRSASPPQQDRNRRFIPTPVGHTNTPARTAGNHTVHPHACGAYYYLEQSVHISPGSSPRLWGIRV